MFEPGPVGGEIGSAGGGMRNPHNFLREMLDTHTSGGGFEEVWAGEGSHTVRFYSTVLL